MSKLHHRAKLTDEQVKDIRHLYTTWKSSNGRKGYGALAEMFGCGQSTIRDIVTYRTRYNLTPEERDEAKAAARNDLENAISTYAALAKESA